MPSIVSISFPDSGEYSPSRRPKPYDVWDCTEKTSLPRDDNIYSNMHNQRTSGSLHKCGTDSQLRKPVLDNSTIRHQWPFVIHEHKHLDNGQYSVGEDNQHNTNTFLPSLRFDNNRFQHAKSCIHKQNNGQTTCYDSLSNNGASFICNTSYTGSMGLSRLEIGSSSSSGHIISESTVLPVKHVSDTMEEDKQLFKSPVDNEGNNQLHLSICDKDEARTVEIIRKATEFDDLNVPNYLGQTALHLAVTSRQGRIVRMLMCAGACVSVDDEEGNTPLHLACSLGDTDIVKSLTRPIDYTETSDNKYQLPFTAIPQDLSVDNNDGETCLELAKQKEYDEIVGILSQLL